VFLAWDSGVRFAWAWRPARKVRMEGIWTDSGAELARRTADIITHDL
jgi:hypothetical protein